MTCATQQHQTPLSMAKPALYQVRQVGLLQCLHPNGRNAYIMMAVYAPHKGGGGWVCTFHCFLDQLCIQLNPGTPAPCDQATERLAHSLKHCQKGHFSPLNKTLNSTYAHITEKKQGGALHYFTWGPSLNHLINFRFRVYCSKYMFKTNVVMSMSICMSACPFFIQK